MCSKQMGGCFSVYSSLINKVHIKCSTIKNISSKLEGSYLFSLFIINQCGTPKMYVQGK